MRWQRFNKYDHPGIALLGFLLAAVLLIALLSGCSTPPSDGEGGNGGGIGISTSGKPGFSLGDSGLMIDIDGDIGLDLFGGY